VAKRDSKILAMIIMFGAIVVVLSFIRIPFPPFGEKTLRLRPFPSFSTIAARIVGVGASLIKEIGISAWTGEWRGKSLIAGRAMYHC
jgi:hypothetical protein